METETAVRISDLSSGSYSAEEVEELPEEAVGASLGCSNPTALTTLSAGEVVLDLGSGGGIDVLLWARRVASGGKAYGLDMTDEMLTLARENQKKAGVENVEFLKGQIEDIPLPDCHVNVVICEFEQYFGMGHSKVTYHLRKLKDAGIVREEKRGKWSFYSLNQETVRDLLFEAGEHLGLPPERKP